MKPVLVHDDAEEEAFEAAVYYEDERAGLGTRFLDDYEERLRFIKRFPELSSPLEGRAICRSVHFRSFPYSLVYEALDEVYLVVACAHHRRRQDYWSDRLVGGDRVSDQELAERVRRVEAGETPLISGAEVERRLTERHEQRAVQGDDDDGAG